MVFGEGGKQTAEKKKKNRTIKVFMIKKEFDNWIGARVKENKKGWKCARLGATPCCGRTRNRSPIVLSFEENVAENNEENS